ncbi:MAG: threonine synthase [Acidobacteriota bacterium]|nr:threonine synthase [Acidobacteriota bacterium]
MSKNIEALSYQEGLLFLWAHVLSSSGFGQRDVLPERIRSMSYLKSLQCKHCGKEYPPDRSFVCLECFGPLEVTYDYAAIQTDISPIVFSQRAQNLWRYRELLPLEGDPIQGFNSGYTPLVKAKRLAKYLNVKELYLKDDSVNHPTLSYKDRVVPIALSRGAELGYTVFSCASTGNLASSVAAHCARAGFPCLLFIPHDIESAKITGSLLYKPHIIALEGNYDDVNRLCAEIGDHYGWGFVNVNLRPYYTEGAKTMGYEIAEQLGWKLPDHMVLPTAGGTLLPKVAKAFRELIDLDWVEGQCRIHSAQAAGCAPIIRALHDGHDAIEPVKPDTLAKSIAIGNPADGPYVLQAVRDSGGWGESATDPEILEAVELLAKMEGIFTEPAGGTTLAATIKLIHQKRIDPNDTIVVAITGNGYKTLDVFESQRHVDVTLRPNLRVFREWYEEHQLVSKTQVEMPA